MLACERGDVDCFAGALFDEVDQSVERADHVVLLSESILHVAPAPHPMTVVSFYQRGKIIR